MSTALQATQPAAPGPIRRYWKLLLAAAALVAVLLLPTPAGLTVAGHHMLAVLVFAVIVWMTEALDYAVSAVVIAALMALLLGFAPNQAHPDVLLGTRSEEHTSELQVTNAHLVFRLLLEKTKQ